MADIFLHKKLELIFCLLLSISDFGGADTEFDSRARGAIVSITIDHQ